MCVCVVKMLFWQLDTMHQANHLRTKAIGTYNVLCEPVTNRDQNLNVNLHVSFQNHTVHTHINTYTHIFTFTFPRPHRLGVFRAHLDSQISAYKGS